MPATVISVWALTHRSRLSSSIANYEKVDFNCGVTSGNLLGRNQEPTVNIYSTGEQILGRQ